MHIIFFMDVYKMPFFSHREISKRLLHAWISLKDRGWKSVIPYHFSARALSYVYLCVTLAFQSFNP